MVHNVLQTSMKINALFKKLPSPSYKPSWLYNVGWSICLQKKKIPIEWNRQWIHCKFARRVQLKTFIKSGFLKDGSCLLIFKRFLSPSLSLPSGPWKKASPVMSLPKSSYEDVQTEGRKPAFYTIKFLWLYFYIILKKTTEHFNFVLYRKEKIEGFGWKLQVRKIGFLYLLLWSCLLSIILTNWKSFPTLDTSDKDSKRWDLSCTVTMPRLLSLFSFSCRQKLRKCTLWIVSNLSDFAGLW